MKSAMLCGFLLAISSALPMRADVLTTYDITFTGNGTLPTSGSFTYDSTVPQFSDFIVDWDGYSFNLTNSANNPNQIDGAPACVGSDTGAAAAFDIFTTCKADTSTQWGGLAQPGSANFLILANSSGCADASQCESVNKTVADSSFGMEAGGGNFSISAVPPTSATPEPNTLTLSFTAVLAGALLWMRRRRLGLQ